MNFTLNLSDNKSMKCPHCDVSLVAKIHLVKSFMHFMISKSCLSTGFELEGTFSSFSLTLGHHTVVS